MKVHNNDMISMVNNLIRSSNVIDQKVLNVLSCVLRSDFVPDKFKKFSYADYQIPIGNNQKMLLPVIEGKILQELCLKGDEMVLEIGTGTGYLTCCLSKLCKHVHSIDIFNNLIEFAKTNLKKYSQIQNITLENIDIKKKWSMINSYDVVILTSYLSDEIMLSSHLKDNSKAFLFVGSVTSPIKKGIIIKKFTKNSLTKNILFETDATPLI